MEPVDLSSPRLSLRPFRPEDASAVRAACVDREIQRWLPLPSPYDVAAARGFVEHYCPERWATGTGAPFAVTDRVDGRLLAAVELHLTRLEFGIAEVGYWAVPAERGRGVVTEAVGLVARWAFSSRGVDRLELLAEPANAASNAVAARAGFTREGVLRSAREHRGERRDLVLWSLLPGDL